MSAGERVVSSRCTQTLVRESPLDSESEVEEFGQSASFVTFDEQSAPLNKEFGRKTTSEFKSNTLWAQKKAVGLINLGGHFRR